MDSLSQPQSILDFLAINQKQTCRQCGEFVDCVRLTKSPQRQGSRIFFDDTTRSHTCLGCQRKAAADNEERHRITAKSAVMRDVRIDLGLGLGHEPADIRVHETLHIMNQPTTTLWVEDAAT